MENTIDTTNDFIVGLQGDSLVIMMPPRKLSPEQARRLAAYLVAMSGGLEKFQPVLDAVEST